MLVLDYSTVALFVPSNPSINHAKILKLLVLQYRKGISLTERDQPTKFLTITVNLKISFPDIANQPVSFLRFF